MNLSSKIDCFDAILSAARLRSSLPNHFVQFYKAKSALKRNLKVFITSGLEKGESVILIMTPAHWRSFQVSLIPLVDVTKSVDEGRIVFIDARRLMGELLQDGEDRLPIHFAIMVERLLGESSKMRGKFRVFGELLDILCERGMIETAIKVEKIWDYLVKKYQFALFCGYTTDHLKSNPDHANILSICESHSHLLP